MSGLTKSNKKPSQSSKASGRFATPEDAAKAKTARLLEHVKKIGLKVIKISAAK